MIMRGKIALRRPCRDCEKYFRPTGKSGKVCEVCQVKSMKGRQLGVNKRKGLSELRMVMGER